MSKTVYQPASYRGAPFLVESTSDEGGPRNVIHEFPGRQFAYAEPSGNFPDRFAVEGHLIGPDFEAQLATLEAALRQRGPGKLVHPHRGTKLVALDGPYRVQRNTRELGMVRVTLPFCEAGPPDAPTSTVDTASVVASKVAEAKEKLPPAQTFSVHGPDFLTKAVTAILSGPRGVVSVLSQVNNRIHTAFGLIDDVSHTLIEFGNEVGTLLSTPDVLVLHLQNLINAVFTSATAAGIDLNRGDKQRNRARAAAVMSYAQALGTFGDTLDTVPTGTATGQQQASNQAALVDVVESSAVIETVSALTAIPLDNTDQAGDAYNTLADLFSRLLERGTLGDAASQAMRDLRAAFFEHLRSTVADLPELGRYTPPVTLPLLVLAYKLYGDSARAEDILERNPSIEHPLFVTGGVELSIAQA